MDAVSNSNIFYGPFCKTLKNGFSISFLTEISKPSSVIVVFDQNIDFLCLYSTNESFQMFVIVLVKKPPHVVEFVGVTLACYEMRSDLSK